MAAHRAAPSMKDVYDTKSPCRKPWHGYFQRLDETTVPVADEWQISAAQSAVDGGDQKVEYVR